MSDLNLPEEWDGLTGEGDDSSDTDMVDLVPRPCGRPKKGCEWDALLGVWVPVADSPKAKAKDLATTNAHELDRDIMLEAEGGSAKSTSPR